MTDAEGNRGSGEDVRSIQPHEILQKGLSDQDAGPEKAGAKEWEPLQWVGFALALTVFGYIVVASIAIFYVCFHSIQLPPLPPPPRSEEHTSELQSLRHLVCR